MRDLLSQLIRPIAAKLADDLAAQLDQVIATAMSSLAGPPGPMPVVEIAKCATAKKLAALETVRRKPKAKPLRKAKPKAPPPPGLTTRGVPRQRALAQCSKCGELGKRADSCGKTHNIGGAREQTTRPARAKASASDDSEGEPRAPRKRPSRAVEPRTDIPVIPHGVLVRLLAADRANNSVGDAGGYIALAERPPSLVGHTEERREQCSVHGWVGRVAFERDQHATCAPTGEPCAVCEGRRFAQTSYTFCDRCGGSGVEPAAGLAPEIPATPVALPGVLEDSVGSNGRRRSRRSRGVPRSRTIAVKRITRDELRIGALMYPAVDDPRPKTRGDCKDGPRPCPWAGCKHHLYLDINPETGSIKLNFPSAEPWDLVESCALDLADGGALTLEEVGAITNLTRERVRQIEVKGLHAMKACTEAHGLDGESVEGFAHSEGAE